MRSWLNVASSQVSHASPVELYRIEKTEVRLGPGVLIYTHYIYMKYESYAPYDLCTRKSMIDISSLKVLTHISIILWKTECL